MTIKEPFGQSSAKSKENERQLLDLLSKSNYSNVRFLIAPDKIVSDEAIIESTLSIFNKIEEYKRTGSGGQLVYSSQ